MLPWDWRGCVQGWWLISKYRNKVQNNQIIRRNLPKIYIWYSLLPWCWRGCVQGPYLNIETAKKIEKIAGKWWENNKDFDKIFWLYLGRFPYLEVYSGPWTQPLQYYSNINYQNCHHIIWLAFFLMQILVKIHNYFQKVSNFFSILCFSQ